MIDSYCSVSQLIKIAEKENKKISEIILIEQANAMELSVEEVYNTMLKSFKVMELSIEEGFNKNLRSTSGLTGGDAYKMQMHINSGKTLVGGLLPKAIANAIAVSEYNASMGKIVATPTAGSCGILPAIIVTMKQEYNLSERDCVMAIFTAAGIGMVIANLASVSGAEGGCQAEVGSASAMAAGAATELFGGTPAMVENAVAIAMKNILGLVCDPVAGLVEIPCIKRNAAGTSNALTAAEMALAGIESIIPVDEVIVAMKRIGDAMHPSLKETAEGGLAATPTAKRLYKQVFGDEEPTGCKGCTFKHSV